MLKYRIFPNKNGKMKGAKLHHPAQDGVSEKVNGDLRVIMVMITRETRPEELGVVSKGQKSKLATGKAK
jgi:hypothetical protein